MKISPFSLILFLMHKVSFCWTPIDAERYLSQFDERKRFRKVMTTRVDRRSEQQENEFGIQLDQHLMGDTDQLAANRGESKLEKDSSDNQYDMFEESNLAYDEEDIDDGSLPWQHFLVHPMQLIQLIKRYHSVGNCFFIGNFFHFSILIHLIVKAIIMAVVEKQGGGNKKINEYFISRYYPYTAGAFPDAYTINNINLALMVYCLCSRLLSVYRLIRGALINQKRYRRVWISQINVVATTFSSLGLNEWLAFWRQASAHARALKSFSEDMTSNDENEMHQIKLHLYQDELLESKLQKCSTRELMYHLNVLEFERCYGGIKLSLPGTKYSNQIAWSSVGHQYRTCICTMRTYLIMSLTGSILIFELCFVFLLATIIVELRNSNSHLSAETWTEFGLQLYNYFGSDGLLIGASNLFAELFHHFLNPIHLIRSFEVFFALLLNIPNHIDAALTYVDLLTMTCRVDKLTSLLNYESKRSPSITSSSSVDITKYSSPIKQRLLEDGYEKDSHLMRGSVKLKQQRAQISRDYGTSTRSSKSNSVVQFFDSKLGHRNSMELIGIELEETNNRLLRLIKLSNILYYEFIDVRSMHSLNVNLLFIGNGICVSYMLTLLYSSKNPPQFLLLSIATSSCLIPILVVLIMCAILERRVSVYVRELIRAARATLINANFCPLSSKHST